MLCACKKYGECRFSLERIAEYIGMTPRMVNNAINKLMENGQIQKTHTGGIHMAGGQLAYESNRYQVLWKRGEHCVRPFIHESVEVGRFTKESFLKVYYETLLEAVERKELKKLLTAKEKAYIKKELWQDV